MHIRSRMKFDPHETSVIRIRIYFDMRIACPLIIIVRVLCTNIKICEQCQQLDTAY